MEIIKDLHPVLQALLATLFTWFVTALGAGVVFFTKNVNRKFLDAMLGFAAGVMIAASYWSLLAPSIELSKETSAIYWLPPALGFLMGGLFLRIIDRILPHLHIGFAIDEKEGLKSNWPKSTLLVLAITLHNIPEGLAIGVAFGAISFGLSSASFAGAIALSLGIGLQNFPEGLGVSLPIRRDGFSRLKSFFYGQLSGFVEPIAGVIGASTVMLARPILPYALSFAAGAMIYVVIEEVIPEAERNKNTDVATIGALIGFTVMMVLDVALS